jgi:predicted acyl esterase
MIHRPIACLAALCALSFAQACAAQTATLPSETPARFVAPTESFDYERRTVMIPMRDGTRN